MRELLDISSPDKIDASIAKIDGMLAKLDALDAQLSKASAVVTFQRKASGDGNTKNPALHQSPVLKNGGHSTPPGQSVGKYA